MLENSPDPTGEVSWALAADEWKVPTIPLGLGEYDIREPSGATWVTTGQLTVVLRTTRNGAAQSDQRNAHHMLLRTRTGPQSPFGRHLFTTKMKFVAVIPVGTTVKDWHDSWVGTTAGAGQIQAGDASMCMDPVQPGMPNPPTVYCSTSCPQQAVREHWFSNTGLPIGSNIIVQPPSVTDTETALKAALGTPLTETLYLGRYEYCNGTPSAANPCIAWRAE